MLLSRVSPSRLISPRFMLLYDCPENPCPPGAVVEMLKTSDGVSIRTARWASRPARPRGTICLFQGRSEFIEKYFEIIGDLLARDFDVATFDWRSQGGSDRLVADPRLGHIGDFAAYRADIDAFMQHVRTHCRAPLHCLAHSMGAAILFYNLDPAHTGFASMTASAPMMNVDANTPGARQLARVLCLLGQSKRIVPGWSPLPAGMKPFEGNPVTSDPIRYARATQVSERAPLLAIGGPTVGWVKAAFIAMHRMTTESRFGNGWCTPSLVLLAGEDRVVSTPAGLHFAQKLRAEEIVTFPDARHEIMQERDSIRDVFWTTFDAFIAKVEKRQTH